MSYDPIQQPISTRADARVIDAGLQAHMRSVYNTMCYGLVITAGVAYAVAHVEPLFNFVFNTPFRFVAMFGPLAFLWMGLSPRRVAAMEAGKLRSLFMLFSAMMGLSFAAFFVAYTGESLARGFVVTSGMFAAMAKAIFWWSLPIFSHSTDLACHSAPFFSHSRRICSKCFCCSGVIGPSMRMTILWCSPGPRSSTSASSPS